MSLTTGIGEYLLGRTSRRGFLARATVTATALSVAPTEFLLKPGSAYAAICPGCPGGENCGCSSMCCDGYTQFCCTINDGYNACPPGTFVGGWWKADGSEYCAGPRYYIDCMGECHGCGCGGNAFCTSCDNLTCECALGDCNNRHIGCTEFRYGQCHLEIGCSGRISCRVVSCVPPWQIDPTCLTVAKTDENTANHFAPCQDGPLFYPARLTYVGMAATPTGKGYWLVDSVGGVTAHGDAAANLGSMVGKSLQQPVVGMAATPTGKGYWLVAADGGIFNFGDASFDGSAGSIRLAEPITGMAAEKGGGYDLVATDGGIFSYDTPFYGSMGKIRLTKPVVGMAATPSGKGYWLVASDGGIFNFGDAGFFGSAGDLSLVAPVVGMAATPTGKGYWLVAADGGIFNYGDASFDGSAGNLQLAQPISGMAATPTGKGYWLVAEDGGVFNYGDAAFYGAG